MTAPVLVTERLILRGWTDADRDPFAALNADPEVMEFIGAPMERSLVEVWVENLKVRAEHDGVCLWAVEERASGAFCGFVGLNRPTFDARFTPCVEVGWRLARWCWGRGYATEGARASLEHGFTTAGLGEIVSFTTVGNVRSRRVMERLGMVRDPADDFEHPRVPEDSPLRPHVLYRMSRAAWEAGH